ncbi:MAG: helix-turn-helix domain-containing protein [Candidatus Arsenophonus phytopathogenicus]
MSSVLSEKLKNIRKAENLSQMEFCNLTGISISTVKKYEIGIIEPGGVTLMKITSHSRFKKYALWLMTGDVAPESGQIEPALTHSGLDQSEVTSRARTIAKIKSSQFDQKIG